MNSSTMIVGRKLIPPENGTVKEKSFVVSLYSGGKGRSYTSEKSLPFMQKRIIKGEGVHMYCILNSKESSVVFGIAKQCPPTYNEEY
jgi:hypothetical protein